MILAIISTSLIIFLNSFFIGKIYKRFKKNINAYLSLLYGLITLFGLLFIFITPLFIFNVDFNFIFYYFISFQAILIIVYILNWRWLFITYKINYKNILLFFLFTISCLLGWVLSFNLKESNFILDIKQENIEFISSVFNKHLNNNLLIISPQINYFQYPIFTYILMFFIYLFNINDINEIKIYITFIYYFVLILLIILMFFNFKYKNKNVYISIGLNSLLIFIFSNLAFEFKNFSIIIIFSYLLISTHFKSRVNGIEKINLIIVNFITLFGIIINPQFIIISLVINLSILSINYFNKIKNATDYNFLMIFSSLLCFFISFNNNHYLGLIFLIVLIVIYLSYFLFKSTNIYQLIFKNLDRFFYKNIKLVIVFIVGVVFLTFFIIFFNKNPLTFNYDAWIINQNIIGFNYNDHKISIIVYSLLNAIFWVSDLLILLFLIIFNKTKNKNISIYNFILLVMFTFYNPFFIDIIGKFNTLDFLSIKFNLFSLYWILISSLIYKIEFNISTVKKYTWINYTNISIASLAPILFIFLNNI